MSAAIAAGSILVALVAAGCGIPLPEDLTLLTAGYLAWHGQAPLPLLYAVGWIGIIIGDSIMYTIGRRLGPRIFRHPRLHLTPARRARVERFFARHGAKSVLFARALAGARAAFYLVAGAMRMPYARFLFFDAIGAAISAGVWITVGYHFGAHIDSVRHAVHRVEHVVALVVVAIGLGWLVTRWLRRRATGPEQAA
jgi:membrane protein DedA with SNARE-associated domain